MKSNRIITFVAVALLSIASFNSMKAQRGYKISNSFDLVIGGDFGFRTIDYNESSQEGLVEYTNRNNFERHKLNYRIGINYMHGLSHNLSLKTGLRLSNPGFSISQVENIDPSQDINTIDKSFNSLGSEYKYQYQFIEIPIGLRYSLTNSVCEPFLEGGISSNFYWRTVVTEEFYEGGSKSTIVNEEIKTLNYVAYVSVGGNFTISNRLSGFTQLIARYQLNDLRKSELIERIFSIGLEVGVRYYMKG